MFVIGYITFEEFAQYVANTGIIESHWRPQHEACNPCYMKYDFIGRFENMAEDANHVLRRLTASDNSLSNITFPFMNAYSYRSKNLVSKQRKTLYAHVPRDIVQKLIQIYKLDYELFDYDYRWACNDC